MFEKICIAVITGIILEIFKIILKELIEYIKIKFTRQIILFKNHCLSIYGAVCPIPRQGTCPLTLYRYADTRRQAEGATLLVAPSRGSVLVCDECQGLPYGVSLRLPLDTLRLYRLRRNGVKGGRSPFTLPLTEREPTHLPARDRVATLSLCPTASD